MKLSDLPIKFEKPFAFGAAVGNINYPIPLAAQPNGHASLTEGFGPVNFTPVGSGGIPPWGNDVNGLSFQETSWLRWMAAGGMVPYDATFQAAIAGYPQSALVKSATGPGLAWVSLIDDNVTNPDVGGAGWAPTTLISSSARTNAGVSATYTYAGNPSGHVAGTAATATTPADTCWDLTNKILYTCTTSGSAAAAVWTPLIVGSAPGSGASSYLSYRTSSGVFVMEWGFTTVDAGSTAGITLRVQQGSPQYSVSVTALNLQQAGGAGSVGLQLGQTINGFVIVSTYQYAMPVSWWVLGQVFGL